MINLSLVIPVFNESQNLVPLFSKIDAHLTPLLADTFEVIFVDDGSNDGSKKVLRQLAERDRRVKLIFFRKNFGQTASLDAGIQASRGKYIITLDSDLQNDPADIPRVLELLENGFEFVTGWRKNRKDGFILRTLPSKIANWIIRRVTHTTLHDLGCSLKGYHSSVLKDFRLYGEMHRFIGALVEGSGAKTTEIEVKHHSRIHGVSKYGLSRTFKVILDLITVWYFQKFNTKPIYIMGGAGLSFLMASILINFYVLYEKVFLSIFVHRNPLFLIALMFFFTSIQLFSLGIMAEVIVRIYFSDSRQAYIICEKVNL